LLICLAALACGGATGKEVQQDPPWLSNLPPDARGPILVELAKLTASNHAIDPYMGNSAVAVSGDTIVLGSALVPSSNRMTQTGDLKSHKGAAYVFVKPATGWAKMTQTATLTSSSFNSGDSDWFGQSISISGDTIVVGAFGEAIDGNGDEGAAYVFVKPAGGWVDMTQTATLTASDGEFNDELGISVSISGHTIVAGAPGKTIGRNLNVGAAYVFVEPHSGWANMTQTAEFTASIGSQYASFGNSVSVSGNTIVVGTGPDANNHNGGAYVFVKPATGWTDTTQTAELSPLQPPGLFGYSVSISGNTAVIGAFNTAGIAYVFVEPTQGWENMTQTAELIIADRKPIEFGESVAISGGTIVVGAPRANGNRPESGAAYLFTRPAGGWKNMTPTEKFSATDGQDHDAFGWAVAVGGGTVVAEAFRSPRNQPAAYVFGRQR
jgi:hypothetical protein